VDRRCTERTTSCYPAAFSPSRCPFSYRNFRWVSRTRQLIGLSKLMSRSFHGLHSRIYMPRKVLSDPMPYHHGCPILLFCRKEGHVTSDDPSITSLVRYSRLPLPRCVDHYSASLCRIELNGDKKGVSRVANIKDALDRYRPIESTCLTSSTIFLGVTTPIYPFEQHGSPFLPNHNTRRQTSRVPSPWKTACLSIDRR
jgi:hypothetical protein